MSDFQFYEQLATNNDDSLLATPQQVTFTLNGNDTIWLSYGEVEGRLLG